jgi:hypothetical protein
MRDRKMMKRRVNENDAKSKNNVHNLAALVPLVWRYLRC